MKLSVLASLLMFAQMSFAASTFSAYTKKNVLFVSVMVDTCNSFRGGLEVSGLCNEDRMTRNYATTCEANITLLGTKMACPTAAQRKYSFKVNLSEARVAREAKELVLTFANETKIVKINK